MTPKEERLQFVRQRIAQIRQYLLSSGETQSISIDGAGTTVYDRKGAREELKELEREERNLVNPNRWMRSIDLSEAF
jgi:predicted Rdx family selenoprotein